MYRFSFYRFLYSLMMMMIMRYRLIFIANASVHIKKKNIETGKITSVNDGK